MSVISEIISKSFGNVSSLDLESRTKWNLNESSDRDIKRVKKQIFKSVKKELKSLRHLGKVSFRKKSDDKSNWMNSQSIEINGAAFSYGWFMWNEHNISDLSGYMSNLYDTDKAESKYQYDAMKEDFPQPNEPPFKYNSPHLGYWLRLKEFSSELQYINIDSLSTYVCYEIEERIREKIEELAPYGFVEGPDHGKQSSKNTVRWDMKATPNDPSIKEFFDHMYRYSLQIQYQDFYESLVKDVCISNDVFVIQEKEDRYATGCSVVFSSVSQLKKVSPSSFWSDINYLNPLGQDEIKIYVDRVWCVVESKINDRVRSFLESKGLSLK